jgi:DNA polymerase lambda
MNKKICEPYQILNPATNRCVSINGKIGKSLLQPKKSKNLKFEIIQHLTEIKQFLMQNKEYYKVKAYSNVLTQLYGLKEPIYNYNDFISNIKVGERIALKVKELIDTGKIKYEEENIIKDSNYYFREILGDIYGIGKAKADELIAKGIKSIDDLKKNQQLLNEKQKIGLKYYEDIKLRIPLDEFKLHKKLLEKDLKKQKITYDFVGSYRRESNSMGDIDIIIKENKSFNLIEYINKIKETGYILETLASGKHKFMGIVRINNNPARRLDILIAPENEYYYSLLYFTGSADFNVGFRNYVKNHFKLSLSEHGLKGLKTSPPIINSEKDIFDYFKIPYLKPKDRKVFINPIK